MIWLWLGFFLLILFFLALDLGVFNRRPHKIGLKEAMGWSVFWIAIGISFSGVVYLIYECHWCGAAVASSTGEFVKDGWLAVIQYLTAYILEKSLSIDNIFVMSMIFTSFGINAKYQHRVLYWGIVGAIIFRVIFIAGGVWLVSRFDWIFYIFGAYLVYTGIRLIGAHQKKPSPEDSWVMRAVRKAIPLASGDHGHRFTAREGGKFVFTTLTMALIAIEISDVIFAVDSIPAVLAISTDTFIVVTSNIFAILGLRSLYFVVADMINRFRYLSAAMSVILILIGAKMLAHHFLKVPNVVSLAVVGGVVAAGIIASLLIKEKEKDKSSE